MLFSGGDIDVSPRLISEDLTYSVNSKGNVNCIRIRLESFTGLDIVVYEMSLVKSCRVDGF